MQTHKNVLWEYTDNLLWTSFISVLYANKSGKLLCVDSGFIWLILAWNSSVDLQGTECKEKKTYFPFPALLYNGFIVKVTGTQLKEYLALFIQCMKKWGDGIWDKEAVPSVDVRFWILMCQSQKPGRNGCKSHLDHLKMRERKKNQQPNHLRITKQLMRLKQSRRLLKWFNKQLWTLLRLRNKGSFKAEGQKCAYT